MKNEPLIRRSANALIGILFALKSEKSFRTQIIVAIIVVTFLGIIKPPVVWWSLVFIAITMVLGAELFNSALETLCDFVQPDHSEQIKRVKDMAAGAVLVASIGAVTVALLLVLSYF